MATKLLATSRNGIEVFLNDAKTNVHVHIQENANLLELVKEAVEERTFSDESRIVFEQDMGRIVGQTSLVKTSPGDEIVYAKRNGRDKYSRFVKKRVLSDASYITVALHKEDGIMTLWTAWCGRLLPREAYAENAYKPGGFWANHALVYDSSIIQPGSECDKIDI